MSIARSLLRCPNLSPCSKIVASYLSTFRRWYGRAQTLADDLGYSLRSVQRALVELASSGWTVLEGGALRLLRGDEHVPGGQAQATGCAPHGAEAHAQDRTTPCGSTTPVSSIATPVSPPPSIQGINSGKEEARRRQVDLFDFRGQLLDDQSVASAGLDVGPLVVGGDAALTYASAVASDGRERVLAVMRRTAEDAAAGRIPRHFWSRLFCGGGYAARRQAIVDVDAAERRLAATPTPVAAPESGSLRELDPARLLAELAPAWLRSSSVPAAAPAEACA